MTQYDSIANRYAQTILLRSDRTQVMVPTARHYLGNLSGKRVLDLACGEGYFTRLIKSWGASEVVGVDISEKMIELARANASQGIQYVVADATTFYSEKKFDVIFASFLLHYSKSRDELFLMCRNIFSLLSKGGSFVSFNSNPFKPLWDGIVYGVGATALEPLCDGSKMRMTHYVDGVANFSFEHCFYIPQTYDSALRAAGFESLEWLPFVLADDASDEAKQYWARFTGDFSVRVLRCQ